MIRINLLPADFAVPQSPINPTLPLGVCALLPILVAIPLHLKMQSTQKQLKTEISEKQQKLDSLQAIIRQVQELENARTQLNNRKGVIKQLEDERLRYPRFLDDFVKLIPGNLWLTGISTVQQPQGAALNVSMDVTALDNYAVADLISNLENSQVFTDVDMGPLSASANSTTGGQTISFRVTATYKKLENVSDATKKS